MPRKAPIWSARGFDAADRPAVGAEFPASAFPRRPARCSAACAALLSPPAYSCAIWPTPSITATRPGLELVEAACRESAARAASGPAPRAGSAETRCSTGTDFAIRIIAKAALLSGDISWSLSSSTSSCASPRDPVEGRRSASAAPGGGRGRCRTGRCACRRRRAARSPGAARPAGVRRRGEPARYPRAPARPAAGVGQPERTQQRGQHPCWPSSSRCPSYAYPISPSLTHPAPCAKAKRPFVAPAKEKRRQKWGLRFPSSA